MCLRCGSCKSVIPSFPSDTGEGWLDFCFSDPMPEACTSFGKTRLQTLELAQLATTYRLIRRLGCRYNFYGLWKHMGRYAQSHRDIQRNAQLASLNGLETRKPTTITHCGPRKLGT